MANVTVSVPTSNITVDTTNSIVNVASTVSNVLVGESVFISNSEVRAAISVSNESGFGNLAYDNSTGSNGIIQYTGVSTSDIRGQISASPTNPGDGSVTYNATSGVILYTGPDSSDYRAAISATAPITYDSGTGVIAIDANALFTGKTTDDLAEGSTNLYFTDARANAVIATNTTDNITEGSTNEYFTTAKARASISGGTGITYNSTTGVIQADNNGDITGVYAGAGLTGGGSSGEVTLSVGAGDGISVDTNRVNLSSSVAGAGLAYTSGVLSAGAGVGLFQSSDALGVNLVGLDTDDLDEGTTNQYFTGQNAIDFFNQANSYVGSGYAITVPSTCSFDNRGLFQATRILVDGDGLPAGQGSLSVSNGSLTVGGISGGNIQGYGNLTVGNVNTNLHTMTGNVVITGNLQVSGNVDYVNAEDLLVKDQSISLNVGNVTQDAMIIVDRTNSPGSNAQIRWNETTDKWTINGSDAVYYNIPTSTTDLAEGTNLYYTQDRANAAIAAYRDGIFLTDGDFNTQNGNIQAVNGYFIGDGSLLTNLPAANIAGDIDLIAGNITTTGTITAGLFEGDINGAVLLAVHNNTGTRIDKGNVVYLPGGNNGDNPYVDNARADSATTMPAFGIAFEHINASSPGEIVTLGELTGLDMTGFTTGDTLYVSPTTAGAFQNTAPTSETHLIQSIGKVVKGGPGGALEFTGAGRTNATPNLDEGNIFLGSSSNTAIAVTPDSNFDTTGNAFSLSNALTDVNTITSESASGLTFNSSDGTIVTSKFGVNSTVTETANIAGKGFGVFNFTDGTNTSISYSGTSSLEWYEIDGSVVSGSTTMTITSVVRGIDSSTGAVSDIIVGQVIANGTSASTPGSTDMIIFPDDAYVVSVDSGAGTVEMSEPAVQTTSFTHSTDGIILDAGLVDTTTGLVIKLLSQLRALGGGSDSALLFRSFRNFPFGYPASGPVPTDFDIITAGTASDYSMSLSTFMLGQTPITNDTTVLNAPLGITIGENTQLTNRAENDGFSSFGMNMMWDGLTSYSRNIQPQVLFKSYTDNAEQESAVFTAGAGPRLFFSSADGNSNSNAFDTYPKANQELGRLAFWGTTGEQLTPSSYNVPGFISVAAADDWDTWGGGVAGNTNVYMGSTSDGLNPDTFLSYKEGELLLGSNSSKPITFAPAYNGSARDPDDAYTGNYTTWANVNYSNTGASKGAKLSVTNGGSDGVGVVGDLEIGVFRNDITDGGSNVTVANNYYSGSSNYYTAISVNAGPTLIFGALFGTTVDLTGLNDGDQATFDNYTGTLGTEINGNTYYVKVLTGPPISNPLYANYGIGLYDDAALTTPTTLTSSTGDYGSSGTIEYTGLPSVTDREYKFKLEEQSEKLQLVTVDATPTSTTLIEYSEAITDFKNRVKLKSHTSAEILALTGMTAGEMVYNSTDNLVAYYDGTDWRNIAQGAIIT